LARGRPALCPRPSPRQTGGDPLPQHRLFESGKHGRHLKQGAARIGSSCRHAADENTDRHPEPEIQRGDGQDAASCGRGGSSPCADRSERSCFSASCHNVSIFPLGSPAPPERGLVAKESRHENFEHCTCLGYRARPEAAVAEAERWWRRQFRRVRRPLPGRGKLSRNFSVRRRRSGRGELGCNVSSIGGSSQRIPIRRQAMQTAPRQANLNWLTVTGRETSQPPAPIAPEPQPHWGCRPQMRRQPGGIGRPTTTDQSDSDAKIDQENHKADRTVGKSCKTVEAGVVGSCRPPSGSGCGRDRLAARLSHTGCSGRTATGPAKNYGRAGDPVDKNLGQEDQEAQHGCR
jgi:hypothetical protein